jgi:hypothetical protein
MSDPTPQPQSSDAILGGKTPPPVTGAVLGGLEGAKQRLESENIVTRSLALRDAFRYGDRGIDLAVQALSDRSEEFQRLALRLLRNHETGKQALLERQPLNYFTTLADWRHEVYNPQVGIVDPENNAYMVRMGYSGQIGGLRRFLSYNLSQFEALIQDPRVGEVQALVVQIDYNSWDRWQIFQVALDVICDAKLVFSQLKALFIGDILGDRAPEFKRYNLDISGIRPFLAAFPQLEVLQVAGYLGDEGYTLNCEGLRHEHLKTLIIKTADITQENIEQLCHMNLPNLEYFELWFGRCPWDNQTASAIQPVLSESAYPKLKYIGLCSCNDTNKLVKNVLKSPVSQQLAILDLKMGTMTDEGLLAIWEDLRHLDLKLLNVSGNYLSERGVSLLVQLPYQVEAEYQNTE